MSKMSVSTRRLLARRSQLEHEYNLAQQGLAKGTILTVIIFIVALVTMGGALYAFVARGEGFLNGNHLVAIFFILVAGLVIYYSFVFGRLIRLKGELGETIRRIEISAGDSVRNTSVEKRLPESRASQR